VFVEHCSAVATSPCAVFALDRPEEPHHESVLQAQSSVTGQSAPLIPSKGPSGHRGHRADKAGRGRVPGRNLDV
jgi:hypothetical protein